MIARYKLFGLAPVVGLMVGLAAATGAFADEGHSHESDQSASASHDMAEMNAMMAALGVTESNGPQLVMPMMNAARGRLLFASKGCVACHSIDGVGGEDAPSFDAHSMMPLMNPFEFAARMWRGAATMIYMQEEAMGGQIEFTGAELADIIAFVHDEEEQHKFSEADIPPEILPMMDHMHGEEGGGAMAHAEELGHGDGDDEDGDGEDGHHDDESEDGHDDD